MGQACGTYGSEGKNSQGLLGKPEGKGPLEIRRYRWENDIKIHLKKQDGWAWIGLMWPRKESVGKWQRLSTS